MKVYSFWWNVVPKSFAHATRFTKFGVSYKTNEHREYQAQLLYRVHSQSPYKEGTFPLDGPLLVAWIFYLPRIQRNLNTLPDENMFHVARPDLDNLGKVPQDFIQLSYLTKGKSKKTIQRLGLIKNDSIISVSIYEKLYVRRNQEPKIRLVLWDLKNNKIKLPMTPFILNALAMEQSRASLPENGKTE
jgi:Holliday junction resolvase RusA-like endonuclease